MAQAMHLRLHDIDGHIAAIKFANSWPSSVIIEDLAVEMAMLAAVAAELSQQN